MDLAERLGVDHELLGVRRSPSCGVVADRNSYARIRDTISKTSSNAPAMQRSGGTRRYSASDLVNLAAGITIKGPVGTFVGLFLSLVFAQFQLKGSFGTGGASKCIGCGGPFECLLN